ncbi:hypothetical protein H8959_006354, partial [Pygathrix nigripes]
LRLSKTASIQRTYSQPESKPETVQVAGGKIDKNDKEKVIENSLYSEELKILQEGRLHDLPIAIDSFRKG